MQNMLLSEGDIVQVKSATLPKGTYVKLQPHTKDFLDISNPKAVLVLDFLFLAHNCLITVMNLNNKGFLKNYRLETTLRNFSCLTVGDNIMVAYNNKKYYIDIIEAKPSSAITIIETDCEVDFAPPLDYKEPEPIPPRSTPSNNTTNSQGISRFSVSLLTVCCLFCLLCISSTGSERTRSTEIQCVFRCWKAS